MKHNKHLNYNKILIINQSKTSKQIYNKIAVLLIMVSKILMNKKMIYKIRMEKISKINKMKKRSKGKKIKNQSLKLCASLKIVESGTLQKQV